MEPAVRCPPISRDGCTYRYYVTEEPDFPIHVEFQGSEFTDDNQCDANCSCMHRYSTKVMML